MNFKKLNLIGGWIVFAIAMFVYGSTIEPTTSFWDCGEYIATSNKLEVGHPPGAPTFMLIGRVVSMFASPENVAIMINLLSALSSALTILFMFWSISYLAKKMIGGEEMTKGNTYAVLGSAFVGSLAFTFSDTFWFSAVEGEVYAMSMFCTALVFWAILRWDEVADEPHSNRWLVFIAYVIGLSIGVHLLNLLTIPAIGLIYYFRKYETTPKGILIALGISIAVLGFLQMIVIPQVVNISAKFEMLFTNSFGMPFHTGSIVFALILIGGITYGLMYTQKKGLALANTAILSFAVLLIGYSTFGIILIRSNTNTPIDENNPENMINLLSYLNREQYGDAPLAKGYFFDSPLDNKNPYKDGNVVYYPDENTGKYEVADERKSSIPNYAKEFDMLFPRMWSNKSNHKSAYKAWSDFKGKPERYKTLTTGKVETIYKPTFMENIRYFMRYQVWWMWGRYLMWNFAGRQNDLQGHGIDSGQFTDGNWLSGIKPLDNSRLGDMSFYPSELENNKAYNKFYLLPLILGLIGILFQYKYDPKNSLVILLLFMFTGLAIAVFLNSYPYQPRERDYAFVGSFFAFAIWIGLGVMGLYKYFRDKIAPATLSLGLTVLCTLAVPIVMAAEGWDDHDRSGRYTAREIARNYLDSCAPNAILFTNGDNDTFPLWYLQEVEGYRTDIRVVNLMLLNTDWYIEQMARKAYDGAPIPIDLTPDQYRQGTRDFIRYSPNSGLDQTKFYDVKQIVKYITNDKNKVPVTKDRRENLLPTKNFKLKVDKQKVLQNGIVSADMADQIVDELNWSKGGNYLMKNELIVLNMLANFNWERPIYFSITMGTDAFYGLQNYFQQEGFAYRLVPVKTTTGRGRNYGRVDLDIMYDNMMNKFKWGGYENPELFMDENNARFITNIRFTFTRLAEALVNSGQKGKAKEVLDRCVEVACHENTRFDGTIAPMIDLYYKIGENEKANELTMKVVNREKELLEFLFARSPEEFRLVESKARQSFGILSQLRGLATQMYPQKDITPELNQIYNELAQEYQSMVQ